MSALPDLPPLPAEYALARGARGICVRQRDWLDWLEEAGYGLEREPRTSTSALGGRKPLEELASPRGTLLLRRFSHGGLLRALTGSRFHDAARPFRELALSAELCARGIGTPRIVGARARAAPGGGWYLDVLSLRVEQAHDLESRLAEQRVLGGPGTQLRELARRAGSFVRAVHEAGLDHVDLTTKNLLVGAGPSFLVLDLDRSRLELPLSAAARERNLSRLLRFVLRREEHGARALSPSDYLRFLAGYEPARARRRELARAIVASHGRNLGWHRLGWGLERVLGLRRRP